MTSVGSVLELSYGRSLKESDRDGGDFPVVGSGGIVGGHSESLTGSPTIVVGRKGSIGSVTWIDGPAWPIDTAYFVRLKRNDVDHRWLYWMLKSLRMETMNKSAAVPGLNRDDVYRLGIYVPTLNEQRRIASILDHADALRIKRRQALAHFDSLNQSIFYEMFGLPHEWPSRWEMNNVGGLASSISYGTSAKAGASGRWPVLRMGNITDEGRLDLRDLKYMELQSDEEPKYTVLDGDLLFNRTNSKEKVGKAAVIRTSERFAFAGYLVRVRFSNQHFSELVSTYLRSTHGRAVRLRLAKSAVNQANINAKELSRVPVPAPPDGLVAEFAKRVHAIESQRDLVFADVQKQDDLFHSLQSQAFSGVL